ncbi:MAG: diacylglycerol kinase family lipid kinase [Candidatus Humimicrobiaceae bacterium]
MRNLIIINPVAARGLPLKAKTSIEKQLKENNINYKLHISKSSQDIVLTVKKNLNNFNNFIGVGGDGTIHYIANALAGTEKNLGVIPMGSGNDISSNLGIPRDIKKSISIIKKSNIKKMDLGIINQKYYYLGVAGTGFDSEVNDLANNTKLPIKGSSKYTYAVYAKLITFRSKEFSLSYNKKNNKVHAMMVAITNLPCYGGGMRVTPESDPFDGNFDICIIKRMNKFHFVKIFPTVFEGKHILDPHVEIFRSRKIKITCNYNFSVFADGEYICKLPATFELIPKSVNIILPG